MSENKNEIYNWYRGLIRGKFRIYAGWICVIAVLLFADKPPFWPGILLAALGIATRFWAAGHIHKDSQLATDGPYALCRNPLYLGSYLILAGISLMVQSLIIFTLLSFVFFSIYYFIIQDEQAKLADIFGASYAQYLSSTPMLIPIPKSIKNSIKTIDISNRYSFKQSIKNKEYDSIIGLALIVIFLYIHSTYIFPFIRGLF